MTFGRMLVAIVALVAAFALGVWAGPYLIDEPETRVEQAADETKDAAVPVPTTGRARAEKPARPAKEVPAATLAAAEPELQKHLKPIMNRGTDMEIAAQGFRDGEQFAMLAHAARNTEIPFVVLKDRVLEQKKSLAAAIEEFKPQLDGAAEAARARQAARKDVAQVMGDRQAQAPQTAAR